MTMFIIALALLGRVTEWEHYPHYGGGNCVINFNGLVLAGTSGGILFSHFSPEEDKLVADSGWTAPGRLSYDRVSHLVADEGGNLWVSLAGGGIDVFSPQGNKTHYNQIDGLPLSLGINQTLPDSVVYVATTQGLCIKQSGYFEIWDTYETGGGLPSDNVNCIAPSDSGLYVGTTAGMVFLPRSAPPGDPASWQPQNTPQTSIIDFQWQGDTLWAAGSERLFRKPPGSQWEEELLFPGGSISSLSSGDGSLAVGCTSRCYILQNGSWVLYDTNLDGNALTGLAWREGRLCGVLANTYSENRASGSGLALLLPDSTWRRTFPDFGPVSNDLRAATMLPDGSLWTSSNRNGASVFTGSQWINLNQYLTSRNQCFAICPSGNGVFVSSLGFGVDWLQWENGTITRTVHLNTSNGLVNNRVHHAARGNDTTVWFAHRTPFENESSGVSRLSWNPGDASSVSVTGITGSSGLPSRQVSFVLPTGGRYAWAATDGGLVYIDADRQMVLETYGTQDGLPSVLVTSLALHRDGTIYAGTASGLAAVSGGSASPVEGLDLPIESVVCDNLGTVWVSTSDGLKRYYPSTGGIEQYTPFNSPLLSGAVSAMIVESDQGHLWMATGHGMWRGELETGLSGDGSTASVYPDPFMPGRGDVLGLSGVPDEPAEISIFDLTGALVFEYSSTGRDDFAWNGQTADGSQAASGVYMMTVRSGAYETLLMKFALVR